jgi:anti-anti-sigma factor
MKISTTEHQGDITVIALGGRLDLLSASAAKSCFNEEVQRGRRKLVVDLGEVSMIDSSGLGALIGGLKAARLANGDLRLARTQEQAQTILRLTMLDRVLVTYGTVEEALAAYE